LLPRFHHPLQPKQTKQALPSSSSSPLPQKKRKRSAGGTTTTTTTAHRPSSSSTHLENEFLPGPLVSADEGVALGSLDFHELLDEDALKHKATFVNRAPIMMAWACVVAERLGFSREEALSIGTRHHRSLFVLHVSTPYDPSSTP
jgi:hypothetical protein